MEEVSYKINVQDVLWRRNKGKIVILSLRNKQYLSLNDAASFIWELIDAGPKQVHQLAELVSTHFEVTDETAQQDVQELLDELLSEGMILPA